MLSANLIGYLSQLQMITDFVLELWAVLEWAGVYDEVTMQVIRVQMNSHKHLISISPHLSCGFLADFKRLLRCDFARLKALYSVIGNNLTFHTKPPLYGYHLGIGVLLWAVDTAGKHLAVGFVIVLCVTQGSIQILVEIFRCGGFVGIVGVVKRSL